MKVIKSIKYSKILEESFYQYISYGRDNIKFCGIKTRPSRLGRTRFYGSVYAFSKNYYIRTFDTNYHHLTLIYGDFKSNRLLTWGLRYICE